MASTSDFAVHDSDFNNVLVAEDDPLFRALLRRRLEEWGYKVRVVEDGAAAWRELQFEYHPRLLLLDWMMPGIDGVEICRRIRALQHELYSYILVVTSRQEKKDVVTALEAGADDYISKPIDVNELRARMQVGRRLLALQDELFRSREQLRRQATIDSLTGLLNRRAIIAAFSEELARAAREWKPTGVLMLDIDRFKQINDRFGHQAGDGVLAEVAGRLATVVRSYDRVGRYGGEEFLVVLPYCTGPLLELVAERVRSRIAAKPFVIPGAARVDAVRDRPAVPAAAEITVTVSVGGAICDCASSISSDDAIRTADVAMYSAKTTGRNRCVIAAGVRAPDAA